MLQHVLEMNVTGDCLRLKSAALEGGIPMAHSYGKQIAAKAG
jgi:hypothetical protein